MTKIILDTSVIGVSYFHEKSRTGIFRVVDELFRGIQNDPALELSLSSVEHLPEMMGFLKKHCPNQEFDWVQLPKDLSLAKFENSVLQSFPFKSLPQKIIREIFLRVRNFRTPYFHLDMTHISEYDVFHSPFLPIPEELKGKKKPKKVITIHDFIPLIYPEFFGDWNKIMMDKTLKSIDEDTYPICVSESTKNDLCKFTKIDPERVFVVPLAASKEYFYPEKNVEKRKQILKKYQIPTEQKYFLSLSTLEPRKNIERTIRSFFQLIQEQKIDDLNLVLVGTKGWDFGTIFKEIDSNPSLKNKIIITGFVEDDDLAVLYSAARAFVYPSLYEGFGLPPLEAMQCGIPVISSNNSSIPEVVGKAGILVSPTDHDQITEAMWQLYSNDALHHQLSELALQQSERFSWQKFMDEHLKIYQKIS